MRIVAGAWRGRRLVAPEGRDVRPTADRMRQALFDMLMHASWGGRARVEGAHVLDIFAGTGAMGLEALSRGAASCCFIENDAAALRALRTNVAACGATATRIAAVDAVSGDSARSRRDEMVSDASRPANLVFLDPPYRRGLVPLALAAQAPRIASGALIIVETGRDEAWLPAENLLAERRHGAARIVAFWNQ